MSQTSKTLRYIIISFGISFIVFGMLELFGYAFWDSIFAQYINESSESQQIASTFIINMGFLIAMLSAVLWMYLGDIIVNKTYMIALMVLLALFNAFIWFLIASISVGGTNEFGLIDRLLAFSRVLAVFANNRLTYATFLWLYTIITYHVLLIPIAHNYAVFAEESP